MLHDASDDKGKHKNCAKNYPRAKDLLPVHLCQPFCNLYHENGHEDMSYGAPAHTHALGRNQPVTGAISPFHSKSRSQGQNV